MSVLKFTLIICALAGCWQPLSWTSLFKRINYKIYATFLIVSLSAFLLSQFMHIVSNVDNSDKFTDALYMMLTIFVAAYKQVYMWIDRKNIMMLIDVFKEKPFALYKRETIIQEKFEKVIRTNTLRYLTIVITSIITIILTSIFMDFTKKKLTYKAWIPFNYSSSAAYYFVYTNQMIAMSTSGIVNVACDSLIFGLLLHICCQFEILECRLKSVIHNEGILRGCVNHHNRIFEYAYLVNNAFTKIIAIQFTVSMLVICSNLYRIVMTTDYMNFISLIIYTSAILMQIFVYCWFGNEVKLKSLHLKNSIYSMEWSVLDNSNKKTLLLIMRRSVIPIEFSSAHIITMNLDSFVALLKISYSIFNVLRQAQV